LCAPVSIRARHARFGILWPSAGCKRRGGGRYIQRKLRFIIVCVTAVTQRISLVAPDSFNHDKDNFMTRFKRIFSLVLAAFALAGTAAPSFAEVVYNVTNYADGQNGWSLAGTITASGVGTFTNDASAITAWDFTATKLEVNRRYSSSTSTASFPVILNGTLNATSTALSLEAGSALFIRNDSLNDSIINWTNEVSGMGSIESVYRAQWIGDGNMWYGFGNSAFSPIVDGAWTLGTAQAVPEPSTYAMALAGLACGGYSVFRRRKRA
jgi:hypothetical protein